MVAASIGETAIDEQAALAYHESVREAFARAALSAGSVDQRLQIGDVGVRLRFAGDGLARVPLPAPSPLLASGAAPGDVEVEAWDEATTGVGIPEPFWRLRDVIARGDVRSLSGGRIRIQVDSWNRILTMWDRAARRGIA